jgi:hypothetical protein
MEPVGTDFSDDSPTPPMILITSLGNGAVGAIYSQFGSEQESVKPHAN